MKKLLFSLLLILFTGCASTQANKSPYPQISIIGIEANCKPAESWRVGVLGQQGFVVKFKDCLKIETLLAVSVDAQPYPEKISRSSVDLLAAHYKEFLKREDKKGNIFFSIDKIKEENHDGWLTYFFTVSVKETEKQKEK